MGERIEDGGLNRFDRASGKFTRYFHDANDSNSITNNKVRAIYEDIKGNLWVGSAGNGLQIMDRTTGKFTHYYYDPAHPEKLSRPAVKDYQVGIDHITFIREDLNGSIWIGSLLNGLNKYDPTTRMTTHYGLDLDFQNNKILSAKDTTTGFRDFTTWRSLVSKDDLLWVTTSTGNLYNIDVSKRTRLPYFAGSPTDANSFYYEADKNILWIGTLKGLVRKDINAQTEKSWVHDPNNNKSLCNDSIISIKADERGNLWIATMNGLSKFNFSKETFHNYHHADKDSGSISGNLVSCLFIDTNKNIWVSTGKWTIDKLDPNSNSFSHYRYSESTNVQNSYPYASAIAADNNNDVWIASSSLVKLDHGDGKFYNFLPNTNIVSICVDATNTIWAGGGNALYRYDREHNQFNSFADPNTKRHIEGILHILQDDDQNLWITTTNAIVKINSDRDEIRTYGESYGVHKNTFVICDNYKGKNGKLFFGDQNGYYAFFPEQLIDRNTAPVVNFTSFKIADVELNPGINGGLKKPLWQTKEIELTHNQNTFSIDFDAVDYKNPGEIKYLFILENYDNNWHYTGAEHKAYLFNVPPGKYIFKVKAVNSGSSWSEKALTIIISPPWWRTWWAYTIFALVFIAALSGVIQYRSRRLKQENLILENKVIQRTNELRRSLEDLKSAQSLLIQSEKMASLGELTAGIAHEIQNPLNFVNNFSDVNRELIGELVDEADKKNYNEVKLIANNIRDNEEKINHHGKRADAIVKGMLQHSRGSSGQMEPTDINTLTDEYIRLAFHGLRAKDKTFNAKIDTDFDNSIGKINIIPQDIGRVLVNLINNAFYAVAEKKESTGSDYQPTVTISTKKFSDKVEIRVKDNGNGIPQNIIEKIFQPFFTTKPTGQGTGLGLSLAYDIIKAHGGEIKVETRHSGEGSEFIILLPYIPS